MPRSSDSRARLVSAAAALFITRSYHGVGVEELCAAADVRKGSFYHHFGSKSELMRAVIDLHAAAILDRFDALDHEDPLDRLHGVADVITATQEELAERFGRVVGCPFGNLAAELATTDEEIRAHVAAVLAELERRIAAIATELAHDGRLDRDTTPQALAHTVMTQYHGVVLMAKVTDSPGVAELGPALHRVVAAATA